MASYSSPKFELTLDLKLSHVPKSLPNLIELSKNESDEVKLLVLNDHLLKYQQELIFSAVFKQELPLCRILLMDAMETLKEEIRKIKKSMELEPAAGDVLTDQTKEKKGFDKEQQMLLLDLNNPSSDRQWTNHPTHDHHHQVPMDLNLNAKRESLYCKLKPLTQPIWRNKRRSWTPELHARFVVVLHFLGGPEVATPKLIRDHMQVEGLTTNQVKSHLQKYRLNWRTSPDHNTSHDNQLRKSKLYCIDLPIAPAGNFTMADIN